MEPTFSTPVAFIIFNRPDNTRKVFEQIRVLKPDKLYIIADGPRASHPDDIIKCEETRKVGDSVDWDCQVYKSFSKANLGCGQRVFTGLNWVFEHETCAIILEDDCNPAQPFFRFCDELLRKYKDDTRVMHISGNNYNEEQVVGNASYFLSRYGHIWGWATWARAWKLFDFSMKTWPQARDEKILSNYFTTPQEVKFFTSIFDQYYLNDRLPWGYRWFYNRVINGGLSVVPALNLVTNIGHTGTHSSQRNSSHYRNVAHNFKITSHPEFIIQNNSYDVYHFNHHICRRSNFIQRSVRKIMKTITVWRNHIL